MPSILSKSTGLGYGIAATMLGVLTHPYQTMQKVVSKDIPIGFVFFPFLFCLIGWFVAHEFSSNLLQFLPLLGLWWFLECWWLSFWGLWQVTLLYLFWRFSSLKE
jgi:hypothetical protein